jgi:transposase-like protein
MRRSRSRPPVDLGRSAFSGFRFPPEVIILAVRWYLRYGLSYRDLEELLAERGVEVDHVTLFRWVQRFTPLLMEAARPCRHAVSGRWFVDETYVKVSGVWRYVYRAVDDGGQVIDVYVSVRRDIAAARGFFTTAIAAHGRPDEVVTDLAQALETVIEEVAPHAFHNTAQYAKNRVERDHGRLKARLRPMRGLKTDRTARVVIAGHALMQNFRRGHYELGIEADPRLRVRAALTAVCSAPGPYINTAPPARGRSRTSGCPVASGGPTRRRVGRRRWWCGPRRGSRPRPWRLRSRHRRPTARGWAPGRRPVPVTAVGRPGR